MGSSSSRLDPGLDACIRDPRSVELHVPIPRITLIPSIEHHLRLLFYASTSATLLRTPTRKKKVKKHRIGSHTIPILTRYETSNAPLWILLVLSFSLLLGHSAMAKGGTCASIWEKRVDEALRAHLHRDAVFLAERMHAEAPTSRSAHALARAHYARGDKASARHTLLGESYDDQT